MAKDKKSVLLYCDIIHTVEKMDNETAGQFFKHYLRYINDLNPETENLVVDIAFESVKQNLKRDLKKWELRAENSRNNGRKGGRPRKPEKPNGFIDNPPKPEKPVTDTVTVTGTGTVTVTGTVKEKDINTTTIDRRKLKFASTIKEYKDSYPDEMRKDFYEYWTEPNKSNTKMRFELEKTWSLSRRLKNWAKNDKNDKNFNNGSTGNNKPSQARTTRQQVPDEYD